MKNKYDYYQKIIEKCYNQKNIEYQKITLEELQNNLPQIDEYIDMVADTFMSDGLLDNYEPNEYGFELEETQDFLLRLRYSIVG